MKSDKLLLIGFGVFAALSLSGAFAFTRRYGTSTASRWVTPPKGQRYESYFLAASAKYGIPPGVLSRMAHQESSYNPVAKNQKSGAVGLMQFLPSTAKDLGIDPLDPAQAIDGAGRYLRQLYDRTNSWSLALAAYNWGIGNVLRKGIGSMPLETRNYISNIGKDTGVSGYYDHRS